MAPPPSTLPAGEAGLEAIEALAVPVMVTAGVGSAASTSPASPPLVAFSVSCSCCRPAETVERFSEAESESVAACCTVFGPADAGAGASVVPLFASFPLAEPENETVPLPETSYCQVKVADAPPASSVPAGEAGAAASVAAALPVLETTGEGSPFRRTAAPPALLSESANDNRCSPAEV